MPFLAFFKQIILFTVLKLLVLFEVIFYYTENIVLDNEKSLMLLSLFFTLDLTVLLFKMSK